MAGRFSVILTLHLGDCSVHSEKEGEVSPEADGSRKLHLY